MSKNQTPQLDYQDRAAVMSKQAVAAELDKISAVYERFDEHCKAIGKNSIAAVNDAREMGILFQTVCQHEQMELGFWNANCKGKLDFNFDTAKFFIAIARKLPEPVKTLEEAIPHVHDALVANRQLELAIREGPQKRSVVSVFQKFFKEVTGIKSEFKKCLRTLPLEQWDERDVESFITETEWLAIEREKALKLRGIVET